MNCKGFGNTEMIAKIWGTPNADLTEHSAALSIELQIFLDTQYCVYGSKLAHIHNSVNRLAVGTMKVVAMCHWLVGSLCRSYQDLGFQQRKTRGKVRNWFSLPLMVVYHRIASIGQTELPRANSSMLGYIHSYPMPKSPSFCSLMHSHF
ncbi:Uncharacterized protein HZ326_13544 [Fusarium oxysporum f. sp. albedinis]|nr:Uncharacterized protein HZ326_13544 [Fusarium oxysporum f. sp. albedinis]